MYRASLIIGCLTLGLIGAPALAGDRTISPASQASGLSSQIVSDLETRERAGIPNSQRYLRPTTWEAGQLARWAMVGQCVATRDRDGSLAYVTAKRGSLEASIAADRLNPIFASCLARSGIFATGNKAYRRAALADALAVRP